jgi:hypothetical protein
MSLKHLYYSRTSANGFQYIQSLKTPLRLAPHSSFRGRILFRANSTENYSLALIGAISRRTESTSCLSWPVP